jgi:hypothetical protein
MHIIHSIAGGLLSAETSQGVFILLDSPDYSPKYVARVAEM